MDTLQNIEKKLEKILNINLKLMDKVVSELSEIKRVLFRFTPSDISHSLFPIPFENVPIEYKVVSQRSDQREEKKKKKAKINE